MITLLLDTTKGILFLIALGIVLWLASQVLMITYAALGDNIGFLALIPTGSILAYLFGHAISAQKDYPY